MIDLFVACALVVAALLACAVYKEPGEPDPLRQSAIILLCVSGDYILRSTVNKIVELFTDPNMTIDLYHVEGSGPCRSVRLAAAALGVDLNLKFTNLMTGEHMTPEFIKMNPQHTVPTMNDNGFHLWESRAIITYLAEQYGKNDSLYPKDPKKRAVVNQRLYFDMGTMYQSFADYYYPMMFGNAPKDDAKFEKLCTAMGFLDKFLNGQNYVAGSNLTVADLALITTVSNYELMEFDMSKYPNVMRWSAKMKKEVVKYEEINGAGLKAFKEFVDNLKKK